MLAVLVRRSMVQLVLNVVLAGEWRELLCLQSVQKSSLQGGRGIAVFAVST